MIENNTCSELEWTLFLKPLSKKRVFQHNVLKVKTVWLTSPRVLIHLSTISFFKLKKITMKNFLAPLSCRALLAMTAAFLTLSTLATAQITMPSASTTTSVKQPVGMTEITLDYSRPSAKGRKVMGELVPFGAMWRTGANQPTKFTTTDSITVSGIGLPKGTYVIMTKPGKDAWEVMFNKNPKANATNGEMLFPADNVVSVSVPVKNSDMKVETFTMGIGNITNASATLDIMWENTVVSIPFTNDIDSKIMAQIKQKLDGPTQSEYFAMSQYYLDSGKDASKALEFVDKALAKGEMYWMLRHKSLVQAKLGDKAGAVATAKKSLAAAMEAKNMDYVRMNEKSIAEWVK
jgi:hypothetical protein